MSGRRALGRVLRGLRAPLGAAWLCLAPVDARADDLVPPTLVSCPDLAYPQGLDLGRQQVELLIELDTAGRVSRILEASGEEPFRGLAEDAARRCRFTPAKDGDRPIAVQLPFSWVFPEPPAQLEGTVLRRGDRQPVAGVRVAVGERVVVTDAGGRWALAGLRPGPLEIRILDEGWVAPPVAVELDDDAVLSLDLWVSRGDELAGEIVGTYDPGVEPPQRRPLTRAEIRATPGSLGDPIRALHSRPGLARTPFDAGWLLVRGGDFDDTGLFLDGVRMPLLFHLGGFTSVLHPEMTETVRFWPGVTPSRYQATSGAVDVLPRDVGDETHVVAGLNTVFAHAFVETPLGKRGGLALAARRSYLDGVLAAVLDPQRARIAPRFWDGQAHLQYDRSHLLVLGLSDTFDAPASLGDDFVTVTQRGVQVQGRTEVDVGTATLMVAPWVAVHTRSLGNADPQPPSPDGGPRPVEQSIVERFPGLRVELRSGRRSPLRAVAGVEAEYRSFLLLYGPDYRRSPVVAADPYVTLGTGTDLAVETGLRLDTLFVPGHMPRARPSPRGRLRWRANDWLAFSGEAARSHKPPMSALLLGLPEGVYMPLEQVDATSAGAQLSGRTWSIGVEGYQRILSHQAGIDLDGSPTPFRGTSRGIETSWHWAPGPLDLSMLYQIGQARLDATPRTEARAAPFDQTHRLELQALCELPRNWTVSGRFRWSSGFPRRPGTPPRPFAAYDILAQREIPLGLPVDALRLAPFHSVDLKIARRIPFRTWELDAWLDVQNVYNRRVVEPLITGFPEPDPSYGFGLPILPVFGIEGRFWPGRRASDVSPPATDG